MIRDVIYAVHKNPSLIKEYNWEIAEQLSNLKKVSLDTESTKRDRWNQTYENN